VIDIDFEDIEALERNVRENRDRVAQILSMNHAKSSSKEEVKQAQNSLDPYLSKLDS